MKWKTIANFSTLIEAQQLQARLAASGVESFIPDEMTASVAPVFFVTKTGIRLQVAEEDEVEALEIINSTGES